MPLAEGLWPWVVLWLARTLSFFNTICLLWLGLTVLLNAERRLPGMWLAGGGLLLGALFFGGHSVLIGHDPGTYDTEIVLLWPLLWWLIIGAPYLWLLVMAWYAGQLRISGVGLLLALVGIAGAGLLVSAQVIAPPLSAADVFADGSAGLDRQRPLLYAYLAYSFLCIGLSLVLTRRPEASDRLMGDLARRRARPWLIATAITLLGVSASVTVLAIWFLQQPLVPTPSVPSIATATLDALLRFDAAISGEIAIAVVLMGQAIGSYELFTGRVLPRKGLLRHWRRALVLAVGYGSVMALSLGLPFHPIYQVLLSLFVITLFYALLSWRSFLEQDRTMSQLRPFVIGQRLYEHLVEPAAEPFDVREPFRALSEDVLRSPYVCLYPLGSMKSFIANPITNPPYAALPDHFPATDAWTLDMSCVSLRSHEYQSAEWAIPLWSHQGLIGALLVAPKRDGGLYTQEEIEVAQAVGERLMDEMASAELSQRLIRVQRQRLAEQQVVDQHTRRVLHDDVLPLLQTALLELNAARNVNDKQADATALLTTVHHQISSLLLELPMPFSNEIAERGLLEALRRAIDTELGSEFQEIAWSFDDTAQTAATTLPALSSEVLFAAAREVARNAAHHGRGIDAAHPLTLRIAATATEDFALTVADTGVGMNSNGSDHGHGIELYSTLLAVVGGSLMFEETSKGTTVVLRVPLGESK